MIESMVIFRCDSSHEIGIGHVKRCLSLADRLRQLNHSVYFCCKNRPGHSMSLIEKAGYPILQLASDESIHSEINQIRQLSPSWVVIDHYQIHADYESQIRLFSKVFVIDDLMSRPHSCDVLLDQNYRHDSSGYGNLVQAKARILMGPGYSLLPLAIENQRQHFQRSFDAHPKKILAFFGGGDPTGEIVRFYQALQARQLSCDYHLVALSSHAHYEKLLKLPSTDRIHWHLTPDNWLQLIQSSDFYFGSVGTVTWERFYFGLPGAVVTVADNQIDVAAELQKQGWVYNYGHCAQVDYNRVIPELEKWATDSLYCQKMSTEIQNVVRPISRELLSEIFGKN